MSAAAVVIVAALAAGLAARAVLEISDRRRCRFANTTHQPTDLEEQPRG